MSPGGGVSVPAGAAPTGDETAADGEAPVADAACGASVLAGPLLQPLAHRPITARTTSRLVTVLALLMDRML